MEGIDNNIVRRTRGGYQGAERVTTLGFGRASTHGGGGDSLVDYNQCKVRALERNIGTTLIRLSRHITPSLKSSQIFITDGHI